MIFQHIDEAKKALPPRLFQGPAVRSAGDQPQRFLCLETARSQPSAAG